MKQIKRNSTITEETRHMLEKLGELSEGLNEPIYVLDPKTHKILFANKKTRQLFGKNIVGKKCYKVFQNLNHQCKSCTNKHIFGRNVGKAYTCEHQNKKNKRWYRGLYKAIRWPKGGYVKYGIAIDITEQKQTEEALKENEQLFRSVIDNSYGCTLIIDDDFNIIYANEKTIRLSGYAKKEVFNQDFRKFLDKDSVAITQKLFIQDLNGEKTPPTHKLKIVRKNGEKRDIEAKSTVVKDRNGRKLTVAQLVDVTEKEKTKKENELFEKRLSALNMYGQSLNMAKSMGEIYKLTLDVMEKILGFEFADFFVVDRRVLCLVEHRRFSKDFSLKLPLDGYKGVTVRAVRTGRPVLVQNVSKDKAYVRGGEGIRSELAVPVKVGGKVLGVLNVEDKKPYVFSGNDRELLEILASHAAIAMTKLKRQERLSALNEYGQSLGMAQNMEEIYKLTMDAMERILGFEYASILIVDGKMLRLTANRGYSKNLNLILPLDENKGITVRVVQTGKPVLVADISRDPAYVEGGIGIRSELAVPVKVGHKILGVLNVESKELAAFDEEYEKMLQILASHAATAISNLKRRDQLRKLSERQEYLMKSSTEIMHVKAMHQRLKTVAKTIQKFGWRRVVISLRDENLEGTDLVVAGLTKEETKLLLKRKAPGNVWKERLGPKFERFKIGEFYYLPWCDSWIRENVHGVPHGTSLEKATTYAGVPSKLSLEEMVDWHPQDMLYAPLCTPEGKVVGILSMDDPLDGRRPTRESLIPLELFLHQAAITIENAQLIDSLRDARKQLEEYTEQLEQKMEERTCQLKKSQEQLLKAQRFAVIGELAGMVGHDLRNPLTSIAGAQYYLKKRMIQQTDEKIKEMLELIEKNIAYSNKIINDLLDYSREVELELTQNGPKSIIKEALSIVEIPYNVQVTDLTQNKPRIMLDTGKIQRAFVNIIKNAVEAMPKGGTLTIKSRRAGEFLEIVFADTGMGMSKRTLEKLWTPLFTTKAKGMGFGLPICKRFIEAHGGSISVESTQGKGTTIKVTFPIKPKIKEGGEKIWVKPLESSLLTMTKT
ncbi:GAF domain-containing protein [Candidatus Bathyarchaeota archaeon]|nr:GAF domain-containing protein [Candidatus Bathyarchaeota archaeon]